MKPSPNPTVKLCLSAMFKTHSVNLSMFNFFLIFFFEKTKCLLGINCAIFTDISPGFQSQSGQPYYFWRNDAHTFLQICRRFDTCQPLASHSISPPGMFYPRPDARFDFFRIYLFPFSHWFHILHVKATNLAHHHGFQLCGRICGVEETLEGNL